MCAQLLFGSWCLFPFCVPGEGLLAAFAPLCYKAAFTLPMKRLPHNICLFLILFAAFHTLPLHLATPKAARENPLPSYLVFCPGPYMACTSSHQPRAGVGRALPRAGRLSCTSGGSLVSRLGRWHFVSEMCLCALPWPLAALGVASAEPLLDLHTSLQNCIGFGIPTLPFLSWPVTSSWCDMWGKHFMEPLCSASLGQQAQHSCSLLLATTWKIKQSHKAW